MKRLLYILLLVIGWNTLTAQTYQVNNQKIRFMNALGIPAKDTAAANWANAADTSIILIRPGDSTLWYRYKGDFRKVGTGGGTAIVDTVNTIASKGRLYKVADSLGAIVGTKMSYSDSSLYASRGRLYKVRDSLISASNTWTAKNTFTDSIVGNSFRFIGGGNISQKLSINTSDTSRSLVVGGDISAVTGVYSGNLSSSLGANFATSSGNVGIGTSSPAAKFHVYAAAGGMELTPGATTQFEFIDRNNTSNTVNTEFYTRNGYFSFNTGQYTERLRIRNDGTSSFNSTLSVSGALTATAQGNNITVGVDSSVTSTSYTLVLGDAGYLKRCSNASAITITVPTNASVAFPIGTTIYFSQQGAGKVSVSPATSDVTIQSEGSLLGTAGQHAVIGLIKVNTNRWLLVGNRG